MRGSFSGSVIWVIHAGWEERDLPELYDVRQVLPQWFRSGVSSRIVNILRGLFGYQNAQSAREQAARQAGADSTMRIAWLINQALDITLAGGMIGGLTQEAMVRQLNQVSSGTRGLVSHR